MSPADTNANRLARQTSPYLRQHARNPVDWFPWGEEAFAAARAGDKPIFLSIGYSTCHWCHVMERESFEDPAVARFLNRHFVSLKVDREERPDLDEIYLKAVQALAGEGGWPLSVFLTAELEPFYGGTYFPPEPRPGRPGFLALLRHLEQLWRTRRADLVKSAAELRQHLARLTYKKSIPGLSLSPEILRRAAEQCKSEYDPRHGGFGPAPKFPHPSQALFLLRHGMRCEDREAVQMVLHTCHRMAAGGIYDQLGGGFARYAVDERWLVPHFEKMLYDNAQLTTLYLDAYLASGEARFADVAQKTLGYVLRDLTHPEGGFFSAEDADSEGKEGKFYCWTLSELAGILSPEELRVVTRHFGITEFGNFLDHSDPAPLTGQNILSVADPKLSAMEKTRLASARDKMFLARARRVRPARDDKIVTSWNGLMLGAMARGYAVLGDGILRTAAERCLAFVRTHLWEADRAMLFHSWCDGQRSEVVLLEDHAHWLSGLLDLYEATLDGDCLQFARRLADALVERFYDPDQGGFWQTTADAPRVLLRIKEDYDGAMPSANSVAILALLRLAAIMDQPEYKAVAYRSLRLFTYRLHHMPQAVPHLLLALDYLLEEPRRLMIIGDPAALATRRLLHAAHAAYQPNKAILDPTVHPIAVDPEHSVAFLCNGTSCQPPVHTAEQVKKLMRR